MGGLTSAVHWWEESQLRVLVLTSMVVQFLLFIFSSFRSSAVPRCVRFMTWLTYLAGDAVAIYALATLFNRHKDQQGGGGGGGSNMVVSTLEVMWAPVLLLHLGGHDGITAYDIEDNELWRRHLITAVSQVTVAIYVFCKSWPPDGDERLLLAGILLFVPGVLKCFAKPWALKSASIYSLVSSSRTANEDEDMYPLQEYVKRAKEFVDDQKHGNENVVDDVKKDAEGFYALCRASLIRMMNFFSIREVHQRRQRTRQRLQQLGKLVDDEGTWPWPPSGEEDKDHSLSQGQGHFCAQFFEQRRQLWNDRDKAMKRLRVLGEASDKLFVDLSSPYPLRLRILQYFWGISQNRAYRYAQGGLAAAFHLLYTKLKIAGFFTQIEMASEKNFCERMIVHCRELILGARVVLPWVSIGLFHRSHSEAHNDIIDVKITYTIFCCTAVLECFSTFPILLGQQASSYDFYDSQESVVKWPEMVAQYSFMGYFASNKKHSFMGYFASIAGIFGCKDFVDQRILCMKPCSSSARITQLVLGYLKDGWKKEIHDAPSYRRFNDHSTHWPLLLGYLEDCHHVGFSSSMRKRAFDESVLLWHIATDFCFFLSLAASEHTCGLADSDCSACKVIQCNEMSNYMVYLLFVNPEMLLPGTRRNLFIDAYDGLNHILKDMDMDIPMGRKPPNVKKDKWVMLQRVINTMQKRNRSKKASEPCPEEEGSPPCKEKSNKKKKGGHSKEKLIDDAWALAQRLLDNNKGDEKKMWEEIQRVWVEMLCFSASRCRGYLHAKALGEGGEFLSYVWLTLFHMGMETFTDKLQREEPRSQEVEVGNNATAPPSTPNVSTTAPSTSEICIIDDTDAAPPSTPNVSTTGTTAPSTSEICIIDVFTTDAGTAPSTSEICMAEDYMVNISTSGTTAPSISEICIIDDTDAAPSTS